MNTNTILYWNDQILEYLLNYRQQHPNFKFWLRRKNLKDRLENGHWFQGSDYIFVGFYNQGDTNNKTRTIGYVVSFGETQPACYIEIVFGAEKDNRKIQFYKELVDKLGATERASNVKFNKSYASADILENLKHFIEQEKPIIDDLISQYHLENDFIIPDDTFNSALDRVQIIRNQKQIPIISEKSQMTPLPAKNIIYYGPPGTGKTYEIRTKLYPRFTETHNQLTREEYLQNLVKQYTWWQVFAAVLLEKGPSSVTTIKNHELVQAKQKNNNVTYLDQTIWGHLQNHTILECEHVKTQNRIEPLIFSKDDRSIWHIEKEQVQNAVPEVHELLKEQQNFNPNPTVDERFKFITFHQSTTYEDFIEGIKPVMDSSETEADELEYRIEPGVFKKLSDLADKHPDKEYAIFIDEINRGNIANIFGELITLIEPDKRKGQVHEIKVTLPYSKVSFSVPPNLYIIGTMNTADRSIEALDTALRRRFTFIEIPPKPVLLQDLGEKTLFYLFYKHKNLSWKGQSWIEMENNLKKLMVSPEQYETKKSEIETSFKNANWNEDQAMEAFEEIDLQFIDFRRLLETMNARIEMFLDKDHCLGHAYFMSVAKADYPFTELKNIFYNKIIPLLQEYFYGDLGKMELIIGSNFFDHDTPQISFANSNYIYRDKLQQKESYHLKTEMSDDAFKNAIIQIYQD